MTAATGPVETRGRRAPSGANPKPHTVLHHPGSVTWSIDGKTVLVTGANSGIGKETARGLADRGARVLVHGRSEEKLSAARQEIVADTGNEQVEAVLADFADLDAVRQLAATVRDRVDALDVLVNNAGAVLDDRDITTDGNEKQFQVNHLAPFLLTHDLLDRLEAAGTDAAPARIVNVASEAHWNAKDVPDGFQRLEARYSPFGVYSETKLYNIQFTKALDRRLAGMPVTANCLHPGVIASNFGRQGPWYVRWFMRLAQPFLTSPQDGARTSLYLATSDEVTDRSGEYRKDEAPAACSKLARDEDVQEALWETSERLTGAEAWPEPDASASADDTH